MNKAPWRGGVRRMGMMAGIMLVLAGCFQPVIPIRTMNSYPIGVFYENQPPDRPYTVIQLLTLSNETPLTPNQQGRDGAMLKRGNNMEEKDVLIAKLVVQAQKLGADALVDVKYKVFTTAQTTGYTMQGLAVRYRGD